MQQNGQNANRQWPLFDTFRRRLQTYFFRYLIDVKMFYVILFYQNTF